MVSIRLFVEVLKLVEVYCDVSWAEASILEDNKIIISSPIFFSVLYFGLKSVLFGWPSTFVLNDGNKWVSCEFMPYFQQRFRRDPLLSEFLSSSSSALNSGFFLVNLNVIKKIPLSLICFCMIDFNCLNTLPEHYFVWSWALAPKILPWASQWLRISNCDHAWIDRTQLSMIVGYNHRILQEMIVD